ncbi:antibiotic biosynthesis monooxygenase [Nocardia cyriacigeorgica]|nr:antibiotic biosynthesis monooxygenase [Nocardia cyriacigeorgica]MBF6530869.1 antibiotic biosynthesis monooxygenase [Nocardia cyriacigeorgica]
MRWRSVDRRTHAQRVTDEHPQIVTIFRSRLRPDAEANGYSAMADRMEERARTMPGFREIKTYTAADGERVSIVVFDNRTDHDRWRADPEHRRAQQLGRTDFYSEYSVTVCEQVRHHGFRHVPEPVSAPAPVNDGPDTARDEA